MKTVTKLFYPPVAIGLAILLALPIEAAKGRRHQGSLPVFPFYLALLAKLPPGSPEAARNSHYPSPRHFVFGTHPPLAPCLNRFMAAGVFISHLKNERRICI